MTIRVLIADAQQMVRTGFQMIVDAQSDMEVVAAVSDGAEAVSEARRLRPDVCLFDIRMPKLDGIEVTRILAGPGVDNPLRVVIVTTFDLDEYVYGALRSGATGFLLKDRRGELSNVGVAGKQMNQDLTDAPLRASCAKARRHLSGQHLR